MHTRGLSSGARRIADHFASCEASRRQGAADAGEGVRIARGWARAGKPELRKVAFRHRGKRTCTHTRGLSSAARLIADHFASREDSRWQGTPGTGRGKNRKGWARAGKPELRKVDFRRREKHMHTRGLSSAARRIADHFASCEASRRQGAADAGEGVRIARAGLGLESPSYGRWPSDTVENAHAHTPADSRPRLACGPCISVHQRFEKTQGQISGWKARAT